MIKKTIVVLANSWKKGGRCLAGKEILMSGLNIEGFGAWIRPISSAHVETEGKSEGGQVTEAEMKSSLHRFELPAILEILEIPFESEARAQDQPENWTVSAGQPWKSVGFCPRDLLPQMADNPPALWDTSGRGWSKVDENFTKGDDFASLYLLNPKGDCWAEVGSRAKVSGGQEQKLFKNLHLLHQGITHEFRISDPYFDAVYGKEFPALGQPTKSFAMPLGTHVTVSLTPAYSYSGRPPRYHYKIAAAIITPTS